ncbi:NUDIX domain-containing protein [Caproiciproducens sp. NJN-50]|uniref:NUDIX hydrolase n=1 Tax=Acutalibacteraceae TaxID=3082771 RepID=UPI000FFE2EE6|nr:MULTISPECIES: NUDIX domain-containing protein [Acutalibacteraceae]QAT49434.1 NUDIX domain-containing protein [Caproiciproducens sp. NJN-50]
MPELCDVYDKDRNKTGRVWPRGVPMRPDDFRLVVYAWSLGPDGRVLMTKRHPGKVWGGCWECTGGGAQAGETSLQAVLRELREEIGVSYSERDASLLHSGLDGNTWIDVWLFRENPALNSLCLQPREVTQARWVSRTEYEGMCRRGIVVPACTRFYEWLEEKEKKE